MIKTTLLGLLSSSLLIGSASAQQATKKKSTGFAGMQLSVTDSKGHYLIPSTIDGVKVNLLLDSGASTHLMFSSRLAKKLNKKLEVAGEVGSLSGKQTLHKAQFGSIQMGSLFQLNNQKFYVAPMSQGNFKIKGKVTPIDGIMGSALLKQTRCIFKFGVGHLLQTPSDFGKGTYTRFRKGKGDHIIKLKEGSGTYPMITVTINGKQHDFLIDTGAGINLIRKDIARSLGMKIKPSKQFAIGSNGQRTNMEVAKVKKPKLGHITATEMTFYVVPTIAGKDSKLVGIIGSELLARLKASLDYDSYTLIIPGSAKRQ